MYVQVRPLSRVHLTLQSGCWCDVFYDHCLTNYLAFRKCGYNYLLISVCLSVIHTEELDWDTGSDTGVIDGKTYSYEFYKLVPSKLKLTLLTALSVIKILW